jgi:MFS family permease
MDYNDRKLLVRKSFSDIEIVKLKENIPKRLDSLPFSGFHMLVIVALGISWVLDGYEVSLLSVTSGVIKSIYQMNDTEVGLTNSLYLTGCALGSLFFGGLASRWGRKMLFTVTLWIYIVSIIATSLAINKYMFFFSRFLTGISVGGEYSSIFAAIDELLPARVRGRADLIIDGTWHLGSCISSIVAYLALSNLSNYQELVTRMLFIFGVIFAFPVIFMRKYIPESPRWLLYKGYYKEAINVIEAIEAKCNSSNDNSTVLIDREMNSNNISNNPGKTVSIKIIFFILFKKHRIRAIYALVLIASQAFFYNGIFYTYTLILQNFYHIGKEVVGLYMIPLAIASFTGPLVLGRFFDTWSRRGMIALTFCTSGFLLIIVAINFLTSTFSFFIQQCLWFVTFFIASPAASSAHLTISEIFPLEMRSQAMAIFFSLGLGTGGIIAPFLYGMMIDNGDKTTIFYSYIFAAIVMIFAGLFGLLYGIDAENKSLEQISKNISDDDELNNY